MSGGLHDWPGQTLLWPLYNQIHGCRQYCYPHCKNACVVSIRMHVKHLYISPQLAYVHASHFTNATKLLLLLITLSMQNNKSIKAPFTHDNMVNTTLMVGSCDKYSAQLCLIPLNSLKLYFLCNYSYLCFNNVLSYLHNVEEIISYSLISK